MNNSFKKYENSLSSLRIGKIIFIEKWLSEMEIENYSINSDLSIDVNDSVFLDNKNLTELPDYIKFNKIQVFFSCENNNLISLKGFPEYISDCLYCCNNKIKFDAKDIRKICKVNYQIFS